MRLACQKQNDNAMGKNVSLKSRQGDRPCIIVRKREQAPRDLLSHGTCFCQFVLA